MALHACAHTREFYDAAKDRAPAGKTVACAEFYRNGELLSPEEACKGPSMRGAFRSEEITANANTSGRNGVTTGPRRSLVWINDPDQAQK